MYVVLTAPNFNGLGI